MYLSTPRSRSTYEWGRREDSNPLPSPYEGDVLPGELQRPERRSSMNGGGGGESNSALRESPACRYRHTLTRIPRSYPRPRGTKVLAGGSSAATPVTVHLAAVSAVPFTC